MAAPASTIRGHVQRYDEPMSRRRVEGPTHTEGLRIRLAEARRKLGLQPDQIAERIAHELARRRDEFGLKHGEVSAMIADDAGAERTNERGTQIQNWEKMRREPRIDEFAAWARALGMRLVVELEPAESPRRALMVPPESIELCATAAQLAPEKVPAATAIVERLLRMTPGEVKRLANYLASEADE